LEQKFAKWLNLPQTGKKSSYHASFG